MLFTAKTEHIKKKRFNTEFKIFPFDMLTVQKYKYNALTCYQSTPMWVKSCWGCFATQLLFWLLKLFHCFIFICFILFMKFQQTLTSYYKTSVWAGKTIFNWPSVRNNCSTQSIYWGDTMTFASKLQIDFRDFGFQRQVGNELKNPVFELVGW